MRDFRMESKIKIKMHYEIFTILRNANIVRSSFIVNQRIFQTKLVLINYKSSRLTISVHKSAIIINLYEKSNCITVIYLLCNASNYPVLYDQRPYQCEPTQ